jgi:hypothetical protein
MTETETLLVFVILAVCYWGFDIRRTIANSIAEQGRVADAIVNAINNMQTDLAARIGPWKPEATEAHIARLKALVREESKRTMEQSHDAR